MNKFTAWFNGQPLHSAPLALQALLNALNDFWTSGQGTQVTVVNHPLTRTLEQQAEAADQGYVLTGFILFRNSTGKTSELTTGILFFTHE